MSGAKSASDDRFEKIACILRDVKGVKISEDILIAMLKTRDAGFKIDDEIITLVEEIEYEFKGMLLLLCCFCCAVQIFSNHLL